MPLETQIGLLAGLHDACGLYNARIRDLWHALLTQIPKFGNRARPRRRARPRCIDVLCRERLPIVLQLFCSVSLVVKHSDSRGRRRARGLLRSASTRPFRFELPTHGGRKRLRPRRRLCGVGTTPQLRSLGLMGTVEVRRDMYVATRDDFLFE